VKILNPIILKSLNNSGLSDIDIYEAIKSSLDSQNRDLKKVLLIPPDLSRMHSGAGKITAMYYDLLKDSCQIDILPALGTHMAVTDEEKLMFFGESIPFDRFIDHNWRTDVAKIGEIPASFVKEVSEGLIDEPIDVEVNRLIVSGYYDMIISIGQVVPHEVVGMANYSKNIFVGCGGKNMIDKTHMLGAVYGMERMMGKDHSPVRKVLDYAEQKFMADVPLVYFFTVTTCNENGVAIHGIFIGRERAIFEQAIALSQEKNINFLDKPIQKVVAWLDPNEFKSTWIGNKAVYRTRMAIADEGELIVLAPGIKQFGEDMGIDALIRKYGYTGKAKILELYKENKDLQENRSVAAHLIHASSDGRFKITYAVKHLTKEEIEGVNFSYIPYEKAIERYNPEKLREGFNLTEDGEEIYFVANPALGLWACKDMI
jgi:nickel-dependent lactate racemase